MRGRSIGSSLRQEACRGRRLRQEYQRLPSQLEPAELIIAAQKRLAPALEQTLTANGNERS
jgi:hypothetical protein